jgi:hypothetical protein
MMRKLSLLVVITLLTGCASLPSNLDIEIGPELSTADQQELSFYSPASPLPGASPSEIVSGFLSAGTGPQNDYQVAREYLSDGFASRWRPGEQTLIRVGAYDVQSASDAVQEVSVLIGAKVNEDGSYETIAPTTTNLRFRLIQENGEWRISSAPNLTVVTVPVFEVVFSQFPIYFLDSTASQLVPDVRWFPKRASTATQLVNALLNGPADWLSESVLSAIPAGTKLQVSAVLVQEGKALVDLDATALAADNRQRGLLLTQLRSTLLQLAGIVDVSVLIAGAEQTISAAEIPAIPASSTFALTAAGITRLSGSEAGPLLGTEDALSSLTASRLAVAAEGRGLVVATSSGIYRLNQQGDNYSRSRISGTSLVADMQTDLFGHTWIFRGTGFSSVEIVDSSDNRFELALPISGSVISAAVSPEGARLAVLVSDSGQSIRIFGIVRNQQGVPLRLTGNLVTEPEAVGISSMSWQQSTVLRVLSKTASATGNIYDYPISGPRKQRTAPLVTGSVVEAGFAVIDSYLLSEAGEVWILSGNTWQRIQTEVIDIASGR